MNEKIQRLLPAIIVILGFFTLGISDLIWIYQISDKYCYKRFLPMKQVALTVITFGIYGIIWTYKIASAVYKDENRQYKPNVWLCTGLTVCFLRPFSVSLLYKSLDNASE